MPRLIQPDSQGNCCDRCDFPDPCADCGDAGACCLPDDAGCINTTEADCNSQEGDFKGVGTSCADDPDPCNECTACPDGGLYQVPDPFGAEGDTLTLSQTSDEECVFCGWSAGALDERQQFQLSISEDIDGLGTCGWSISVGVSGGIYFKAWDDGNPIGTYESGEASTIVVSLGEGTVNNPCVEGTCPPAEAPTHMSVRAELNGTADSDEECGEVPVDFSFDHTTESDLEGLWVGDEFSCQVEINDDEFLIEADCPDEEICPQEPLAPQWGAILLYEGGTWLLRPYFEIGDSVICGGAHPILAVPSGDVEVDLGPDPVGTHVVTITAPTIDATLVLTVVIT